MDRSYQETLRVRFRDTDAQGHMFFANYLVFADE
ncbi:MAG: acyl-CoA thioester hydrolase, partial [Congregibacter sp.]